MQYMLSKIPKEIIEIYSKIKDSGFSVFFVGGCVRNLILKKDVKDWDLATIATPEDIIKLFPDTFYDNKFGTVGVPVEKPYKQVVEITTFRTCLLYTSDAADDLLCVDLGGRRIIK